MAEKILPMRATVKMDINYKSKIDIKIPIIQHLHGLLMGLYEQGNFDLGELPKLNLSGVDQSASVDVMYMEIQQLNVDDSMRAHIKFYLEYDMEPNQILQLRQNFFKMQVIEQAINRFLEALILKLHEKSLFSIPGYPANKPSFYVETAWDETQSSTHEEQLREMYARRKDGINFATVVSREILEYSEPEIAPEEIVVETPEPVVDADEEDEAEATLHLPFDPNNVTPDDMPTMEKYFKTLDTAALRAFAESIGVRGARSRARMLLVGDIVDRLIYG